MASITLRIEAQLCGPMSIGTVRVIKLALRYLALDLSAAIGFVDRCVFGGEEVEIPAPSAARAAQFVAAIEALPPVPRVEARVRAA
jgi:hypothetical protein